MGGARRRNRRIVSASFPTPPMTDPQYTTTDWYLAAFVLSQGVPLAGCRRVAPKKVEFFFPASERLHAILRRYWCNEPTVVVPSRLFAAHRRLKTRAPMQPQA